jgi:hypothetical protein
MIFHLRVLFVLAAIFFFISFCITPNDLAAVVSFGVAACFITLATRR